MIGAGEPQGFAASHTVVADKNILHGVVQNMTERKDSRDIGRRHKNGVGHFSLFKHP